MIFELIDKYFIEHMFSYDYPDVLSKVFPNFEFVYMNDPKFCKIKTYSCNILKNNKLLGCIFTKSTGLTIITEQLDIYSLEEILIKNDLISDELISNMQKFLLEVI